MNTRTRFAITFGIATYLLFLVVIIDPLFLQGRHEWYIFVGLAAWMCALIIFKIFKDMITDAWAYITDPEARKLSPFKYPGGAGMSVRVAKQRGLM